MAKRTAKKAKVYYMHTINKRPAYFRDMGNGGQICYAASGPASRNPLAESIKQIRAEQKKSISWRKKQGFQKTSIGEYGYLKFTLPEKVETP